MTRNIDLVRTLYAAFARGDVPSVLAALAPDVAWVEAEGGPYSGTYVGLDAVLTGVFMKLGGQWDGFAATPRDFVANDEDLVVALGEYSGTFRQTGKAMRAPFAHAWTVRGGKVVAFRQYTDTAAWNGAMV